MALEDKIDALIASLDKNTAAILGGKAPAGAPAGKGAGAKAPPAAPKHTSDEVRARAVEVKEKMGQPAAKKAIQETGATDLKELLTKPELYDGFMAATDGILPPAPPPEPDEGL